jgi:glycosyltransferase involved in cell wall biosynthesis
MKISLICFNFPYPPFDGGKIDVWRRIKALAQCGVNLQVISWIKDPPEAEELAEIQKYTQQIYLIPFKRTPIALARRFIDLFFYPLEVTSRIVRGKELNALLAQVQAFAPDVIFLDGIHGGVVATYLSKKLNVPIVTRSHNIEHLYQQRLLASTQGWNKFRKQLSLTNLKNYEKTLLKNSIRFYDISANDLEYWQKNQGLTNGRCLPPLIDIAENNPSHRGKEKPTHDFTYDVVFLGNLYSENNVAGVIWFLTEVLPKISQQLKNSQAEKAIAQINSLTPTSPETKPSDASFPAIKVLIAGSSPTSQIKQLCNNIKGVELKVNLPSSAQVYDSGRVLINPVSAGSGVSIKSIEMLASGRPIVSTPQGLAGLPQQVHQYFTIADNAESFAAEIVKYLSNPPKINIEPELLDSFFGFRVIKDVVSELEEILLNHETGVRSQEL